MNRRHYIVTAGTLIPIGVAGCNSSSDGTSSTGTQAEGDDSDTKTSSAPQFTDVTLTAPTTATVGSEITLTVSVRNRGDSEGTYTDTVTATEGNRTFEEAIEITAIPPGESATTEIGPIEFTERDEYVFELARRDVSTTIQVTPQEAAVGESVALEDGVMATLQSMTFPWSLLIGEEDTRAVRPTAGTVYGVAEFVFENTGETYRTLTPSDFVPTEGTRLSEINYEALSTLQNPGSQVFDEQEEIQPGEQFSRRLLFEFDERAARTGIEVGYQPGQQEMPATVLFSRTPEGEEFTFPHFELISVTAPDTLQPANPDGTFEFTVENTSEAAQTFRGAIVWRYGNQWRNDDTASPDVFTSTIPAGAQQTFEMTWDGESASAGDYDYRVSPFEDTVEISFNP